MGTRLLLGRWLAAAIGLGRGGAADDLHRQYEALARRILASVNEPAAGSRVIGVTSCTRGEGVSTVAAGLAACSADVFGGPVLIVEANFDRPSLADRLGVNDAPGLAEALSDPETWSDCVHRTTLPNVSVMPAGEVARQIPSLATLAAYEPLLAALRRHYPFVVVDLPPATESELALAFSERLDGVLLVLEAERLRVQVVERAKQLYARLGVNVLGVVLNKRRMHIPDWLYHRL